MNKKIINLGLFLSCLVIAGCGNQDQTVEIEKQAYYVQTKPLASFGQSTLLEKSGKVAGEQQLTVTAQTRGKVARISQKEGDTVFPGSSVVALSDTLDNLGVSLERASLNEQRAELNYEQTKKNIENNIRDARLLLEKAINDKNIAEQNIAQSLKRAEIDLFNATSSLTGSKATLDLAKSLTDLDNSVRSTRENFYVQVDVVSSLLDNVIYQGDSLLGTTSEFRLLNDRFEQYLGAGNTSKKFEAEALLGALYGFQQELESMKTNESLSNEELLNNIDRIKVYYDNIAVFLRLMIEVLEASIPSVSFSQGQIDALVGVFGGLQASHQGSNAGFTSYETAARALFSTVLGSDDATLADQQSEIIKKNIEIQETNAQLAYDAAETAARDGLFKADFAVKTAKNTLDNLLSTKDTQLSLLQNAINDARTSKSDVQSRYNKLFISSPIQGTISDILVDKGQEVSIGSPIFQVVNQKNQQIEIFLGGDEVSFIDEQTDVLIQNNDNSYEASIVAISQVANQNLQYKVVIRVNQDLPLVGEVVEVSIPIVTDFTLLPLDIVTITQPGQGFIYIRDGQSTKKKFVRLGKTYNGAVELLDDIAGTTEIVTSSLKNYESSRFELKFE